MTCTHCIDANDFFDAKAAKKELKQYLKKGAANPTKKLLTKLREKDLKGLSLLDIGGGVGVIQLELHKDEISKSTDVDASQAYLQVIKTQAKVKGIDNKMNFIPGDFVDVASGVEAHDIVTLDKVICCYPDAKELLTASLKKCNKYYALTYPLDGILADILVLFARAFFKLKKSNFRPYIHSHHEVNQHIVLAGFQSTYEATSFPWKIYVYERTN